MEWLGNVLSKEGGQCRLGNVWAHLMRLDPTALGSDYLGGRVPTAMKRSWIVYLYREERMTIDAIPLTEVVLLNLMPGKAKEETEKLIHYASAYYKD